MWALSLSNPAFWTVLPTIDPMPSWRSYSSAIYDPVGDRMLVFGGQSGGTPFNETWSLSLSPAFPTWELLATQGTPPPARSRHTAIYDPVRQRMVVYGGPLLNDVWALSLTTLEWTQLFPAGRPVLERYGHAAAYDPVPGRHGRVRRTGVV